jgi:inhibitor of cysteine peptidase
MRRLIILLLGLGCSVAVGAEKPISVGVGQEFKIVLASNSSSGNQWLMARPLDDRFLKLLGSEYKRGRSGAAGAPGNEVLSFKALGEGKTQIYLKYAKLWEKDTAPAQTTNFVVVISTASPAR